MENNTGIPFLVDRLKEGDEKAFCLLYEKFAPKIYGTSRKMFLTHEDAEEIVQEVFIRIWKRKMHLNNTLSFNAYLLTILRSLVYKKTRKKAMFVAYQKYALEELQSVSNETENEILYTELKSFSNKAIASLPNSQKKVFMMKYFQHLSSEEIAAKLSISKRTVESHIYKATKSLKQKFLSNNTVPFDLMIFIILFLSI